VKIANLEIPGAYTLELEKIEDERGWFARSWDVETLANAGLISTFVQQSIAWNSRAGTLRGMHLARDPAAETKIVRCIKGAVIDVIVDTRRESASYGKYVAVPIDAENRRGVYIPAGCAHGYQTLCDDTELLYDISEPYRPEFAAGIAHDDASLAIPWPLPISVISSRDAALPPLAQLEISA
jgi:dTDP-4-dehydrorhamnose 3,5-epimerase